MTLNSTNDPGFCSTKPGAMSFQCHSLEKVFETMHVFLNKASQKKKKMGGKKQQNKKEEEKKGKKEMGQEKGFYFKSKQLSDLLHTCHE